MVSKSGRKTNFRKEEKLLMAALSRAFPEAKNKVFYTKKFQKFNSQNQNGIKREMNQIQGCRTRLKLQFKKEHDLQSREARKTSGRKLLVILKLFAGKKQMSRKRTEKKDSQEYRSNFRTPPLKRNSLLIDVRFSGNDKECSFFVSR